MTVLIEIPNSETRMFLGTQGVLDNKIYLAFLHRFQRIKIEVIRWSHPGEWPQPSVVDRYVHEIKWYEEDSHITPGTLHRLCDFLHLYLGATLCGQLLNLAVNVLVIPENVAYLFCMQFGFL